MKIKKIKMKIKQLKKVNNPKLIVITPLKNGDKISKLTKKTIKRNNIEFDWISVESDNNRPTNLEYGINNIGYFYDYFLPLDNNIELGRYFIDRLYNKIKNSNDNIGYVYGNLEYKGKINYKFPAIEFNLEKLLQNNYISSNSMFKTDYVIEIGLVKDNSMKRLLDWVFLIQMARFGYYGMPAKNANHIAWTTNQNISTKNNNDFNLKRLLVYKNYITPFIEEIKEQQKIDNQNIYNDNNNLSLI